MNLIFVFVTWAIALPLNILSHASVSSSTMKSTSLETSLNSSPVSKTIVVFVEDKDKIKCSSNSSSLRFGRTVPSLSSSVRVAQHARNPGKAPDSTSVTSSGVMPLVKIANAPFLPWPQAATSSVRGSRSVPTGALAPTVKSTTGEMQSKESFTENLYSNVSSRST